MYPLSFKPYMNSAITVCAVTMLLTLSDLLGKRKIPCGHIHSFDIVIVAASRHLKEPAHFADWIFIFVAVDHHIFYACPHFLSVSERKSRISSFSISNCLIRASLRASLYRRLATLSSSLTTLSFAGLPFFLMAIPAAIFRCFSLCLEMKLCICSLLNPNCLPISALVFPSAFNRSISSAYYSMWRYCLDIKIPPMIDIFILP